MTRAEFREMFIMDHYEKMRIKYDCLDAFPQVFDKVSRTARNQAREVNAKDVQGANLDLNCNQ